MTARRDRFWRVVALIQLGAALIKAANGWMTGSRLDWATAVFLLITAAACERKHHATVTKGATS